MSQSRDRRDPPRDGVEVESRVETGSDRIGVGIGAGSAQFSVGYNVDTETIDFMAGALGFSVRGAYDFEEEHSRDSAVLRAVTGAPRSI